jgi:hypothetical protein
MDLHVSETLLPYIKSNPEKFEVVGEPELMKFDAKGKIYPMMAPRSHVQA